MKWYGLAVQIAGVGVITVSSVALLGHALAVGSLYSWTGSGTAMALPTAFCFVMTGIALVLLGKDTE
jgi:hypothetical protein